MAQTLRTGLIRNLDELGRVVLAMEFRRTGNINPGDAVMQTMLVDRETGRIRGVLLEPLAWVVTPETAPMLQDLLQVLQPVAEGPDA